MTDTEHFTTHKSLIRFTSGNTKRRNKMNEKVVVQYYNKEFIFYLHKTHNKQSDIIINCSN